MCPTLTMTSCCTQTHCGGGSRCRRCWCCLHSNAGTFVLQRRRCGPCCPTTAPLRSQFRPRPFRNLTSWFSTTALRPNSYVPSYPGRNSANRKWFTTAGSPVCLTQKVSGCPKTCPELHWTRAQQKYRANLFICSYMHLLADPTAGSPPLWDWVGSSKWSSWTSCFCCIVRLSARGHVGSCCPLTSPRPLLPCSCYSWTISWKAVSNLLVYIHLRSLAPTVFQTSERSRLNHERFMILLFPG